MTSSMLKRLKMPLIALVVINLTACGGLIRDRRDAPWDPKQGQALHEQLPNWEHKAMRQCGITTDRC